VIPPSRFAGLLLLPFLVLLLALAAEGPARTSEGLQEQAGPAVPDFATDVWPILETNCLRCHNGTKVEGGLLMDTYEGLMAGGENGHIFTAGDGAGSRVILMLEGEIEPKMPPKGELRPEEIARLRAWIDAGAPYSELPPLDLDAKVPALAAQVPGVPPVPAVAFSPDGGRLAVSGYREVRFLAVPAGEPMPPIGGPPDLVRSVAYSPDGRWLAAAGGVPGSEGEVVIASAMDGRRAHTIGAHRDYVYRVAFNRAATLLATCSYDRLVKLWDVASGRPVKVLKEHTEAVLAIAFSPDDTWLASASADRTVKLWDVASGERLYTLSDALDAVTSLAFHPSGRRLAAAGTDKSIRTWEITRQGGRLISTVLAHESGVLEIAYSPDGRWLASSGADRTIKIWDAERGIELRALEPQSDWAQGLAWSPDGTRLAVGRLDGSVALYDMADGRLIFNHAPEPDRDDGVAGSYSSQGRREK
jgi:WD40 repeat protein